MLIASIVASILPIFIYLFILWKMDRYEPEPIKLVLINFLWGAIGAIILSTLLSLTISKGVEVYTSDIYFVESVLIAPPIEELMKGIFLFFIMRNINFDNVTDGFVYGGAIGLGFGMTENLLYFITYNQNFYEWLFIVIIRTFFTVLMHMVSTASLGGFLGIAKFANLQMKFIFPTIGFLLATAIHFCWNYGISFNSTYYTSFILMLLFFTIFYFIFKEILKKETQIIEEELYDESSKGFFPKEYILPIINRQKMSSIKSNFLFDANLIKASTKLAFRKNQVKKTTGIKQEYYLLEIEKYRDEIKNILEKEKF